MISMSMHLHLCHIYIIDHNNRIKNKNHVIILVDEQKALEKNQHSFFIKPLNKLGREETYFNIIKAMYDKPTANIMLHDENLRVFPLRNKTRMLTFLLLNIVPEALTKAIKHEKINKNHKKSGKK